jgi:hypothetical protein
MQNTLTKPEWNIRRPPFLFICIHNIKNVFNVNKCHLFANESFCDTLDVQDVSQQIQDVYTIKHIYFGTGGHTYRVGY